jgi:uncharacterized protein YjbI with pentapeptide repeats
MSDLERDSLVSKIEQLERQHQVLAKYIATTKRQLDGLSEQFNNRPELEQLASLQDVLAQLQRQPDDPPASPVAPVEVVNLQTEMAAWADESQLTPVPPYEYQLVFDRSGSRAVLLEALEQAQGRLIIVCPWLNRNSIDADLMQKFRDCLNRNCRIEIGWGHLSDRNRIGISWRYNALPDLRQMEQDYPGFFSLKLLGTHEKFLVCDSTFAMLGSHNLLTSSAQSAEREIGIRTTDPYIIQGLIDRFDNVQVVDTQITVDSLIAEPASLDDSEVLELQDLGKQKNAFLVSPDTEEAAQDIDDTSKNAQGAALNADELSKRYKAGERDFTGINLTYGSLYTENLSGANLSRANLSGISLSRANLTGVNLTCAELSAAILDGAKLTGANLCGAVLIQSHMSGADLSEANLSYTNLTAAYLVSANLMKVNLKGANLAAANLSGSNLRKAGFNEKTRLSGADLSSVNLAGQNLQKLNMSGVNLTNANLCGAWLCFSNLSGANLTSSDLRGADLSGANLEKANLKGANLSGANLDGVKLSGAIMPDDTIHG